MKDPERNRGREKGNPLRHSNRIASLATLRALADVIGPVEVVVMAKC
jgi:hypothetical protein